MGVPGRVRAGPALGEVVVVAAAVALVVGLARAPRVGGALDPALAAQVLTLAAAAVAAGAAVLGALVARLDADPRPRWFAAGLAVYAVVVLPAAALPGAAADVAGRTVRLVAYVVVVVLFALCVRPPTRPGSTGTWLAAAGGTALALASGLLPAVAPAAARALVDGPVASVVVLSGWTGIAAAVLATGLRRGSLPLARAGLGLVVVAAAQLHRLLTAAPAGSTDLVFGALRLLGLLLVVAGLAQLLARTVAALRDERHVHQEELAAAALHVERAGELAAERDHELRNGLAGLAGITHLLSAPVDGGDHDRLRHAVLAELGRLHTLLDGGGPGGDFAGESGGGPPDGPRDYLVAPVLEGLVALRGERPPALEVEAGLRALGDPAVLAQVVTNLLANCDRHAPGSSVAVTARSDAGRAVVEVRDTGPGLPPGVDVLAAGVRDPTGGGTGLGLAISARLVAEEGGELAVRTADDPPGCVAAVHLPAPAPRPVNAELQPATTGRTPAPPAPGRSRPGPR
jgi:two-component system OmpR family sensor kinase